MFTCMQCIYMFIIFSYLVYTMFTTPLLRNRCGAVSYCRDGLWARCPLTLCCLLYLLRVYCYLSNHYVVYLSRNGTRSLNCKVSAFASVHLLQCICLSQVALEPVAGERPRALRSLARLLTLPLPHPPCCSLRRRRTRRTSCSTTSSPPLRPL